MSQITLKINGQDHSIDVPSDMPLLWALRDVLNLTGTKYGCGIDTSDQKCDFCSYGKEDSGAAIERLGDFDRWFWRLLDYRMAGSCRRKCRHYKRFS